MLLVPETRTSRWTYITVRSADASGQGYGGRGQFRLVVNRQSLGSPPQPSNASGTITVGTTFTPLQQPNRAVNLRRTLVAAAEAYYAMTNGSALISSFLIRWGAAAPYPNTWSMMTPNSVLLDDDNSVVPSGSTGYCRVIGTSSNRVAVRSQDFDYPASPQPPSPKSVADNRKVGARNLAHEWGHCLLDLQDEYVGPDALASCGHSIMDTDTSGERNDFLMGGCTDFNWGKDNESPPPPFQHPTQHYYGAGSPAKSTWEKMDFITGHDLPIIFGRSAPAMRYWPTSPGAQAPRAGGYPFNRFVTILNRPGFSGGSVA